MDALTLVQAHEDFYLPLDHVVDRGVEFTPSEVPSGWRRDSRDSWTMWLPEAKLYGVDQGWKIHVSAQFSRAASVLDRAADVFFAEGVAFKHLSCARFFLLAHHKHANRVQAGKFCAAYPRDEATARRVMAALTDALDGEEGPSVLSDRRYERSSVVYYRYGAFVGRRRVGARGSEELLVRDGQGGDGPDRRLAHFVLPAGIDDPFVDAARAEDYQPVPEDFTPVLNGYAVDRVVVSSNSGGAYEAHELTTGRRVFIKEARAHNGLTSYRTDAQYRLRAEHQVLRAVHDRHPGACPAPLDYFRVWTNEYLVTELVPGIPLREWVVGHNPIIDAASSRRRFADYHRRCEAIVASLAATLELVHDCGFVYVDLNPNNVLIDPDSNVRLVDFEAVAPIAGDEPFETLGAPGHAPPRHILFPDRTDYDAYGLSALALFLIAPLNDTVERNPAVLTHLHQELSRRADLPRPLWTVATRFHQLDAHDVTHTPSPRDVAADPVNHLNALRERLIAGLSASVEGGEPRLGPTRYATNGLCVAHGTAGVVHALAHVGVMLPDGVFERLALQSLDQAAGLPPGLHTGLAGIAWVLADAGLLAEASKLLDLADGHPLLEAGGTDTATLGYGRAGVGLAHLALHRHTGEEEHLRRALAHAEAIPRDGSIVDALGAHNAGGLLAGRTGIALLFYYLSRALDDDTFLDDGLRLLHRELDDARDVEGGLLLPVSERDRRMMPYLYAGTAGLTFVASRYLAVRDDERLTVALPSMLAAATCSFTRYGGLYAGMAGLGLALVDHGERHAHHESIVEAQRIGRRMFLYAVPRPTGTYVLGEYALRLSADLSYGSAGVLLFVDHLLHRRADPFFTLDAGTRPEGGETEC